MGKRESRTQASQNGNQGADGECSGGSPQGEDAEALPGMGGGLFRLATLAAGGAFLGRDKELLRPA
jgi:hypothetical protein